MQCHQNPSSMQTDRSALRAPKNTYTEMGREGYRKRRGGRGRERGEGERKRGEGGWGYLSIGERLDVFDEAERV